MEGNFLNIKLSEISSNPANPRKSFEGKAFDELIESIKQKGIIEPIIVRPLKKGKAPYEIVAGERRFRAISKIYEDKEILIPSIVRELSDDEAFDFMIIENLQREDLTGFEEAEGFRQYYLKKGKGAIEELAGRIGKSAGYIRRKIAALSLPKYILKAWEKGELQFSHLEEMRRIPDGKELKEVFEFATGRKHGRDETVSKRILREYIKNHRSIPLKNVPFDLKKEGCFDCHYNSQIQNRLWEINDIKDLSCLNRNCFKQKMNNYLISNWKKCSYYKRFKTAGFRFDEGLSYGEYREFYTYSHRPAEKCKDCINFLTVINLDGTVEAGKACFGERSCFDSIGREKLKKEREKREEKGGPRVPWHGEYFREKFFGETIPKKFDEIDPSDIRMERLNLFVLIKLKWDLVQWFIKEFKLKDYLVYRNDGEILKVITKMELSEVKEYSKKATLKMLMDHSEVGAGGRLMAAEHIGINLKKEWAADNEYLQKKTIKELLEFGEKSGIFDDQKAKNYLEKKLKKKPDNYSKCKKIELIQIFLKSGVNLIGKIPDEIIPKEK